MGQPLRIGSVTERVGHPPGHVAGGIVGEAGVGAAVIGVDRDRERLGCALGDSLGQQVGPNVVGKRIAPASWRQTEIFPPCRSRSASDKGGAAP